MKTRGRPKGISKKDKKSFGPLGDLIRSHRSELGLGLLDVAKAAGCSVQFISNVEHGRAPLPWDKIKPLATVLKASTGEIQAANLAIRSDFKHFAGNSGKKVKRPEVLKNMTDMASVIAFAAQSNDLQEVIQKYQSASGPSRKKFVKAALELLTEH